MERTLAIIKPNAVEAQKAGKIISMIEDAGLTIKTIRLLQLTKSQAESFYAVHHGKEFFDSLVEFMCSGPVIAMVLEGKHAIERYRKLMGATNPEAAEAGTIRALYGESLQRNSVHGSDSPETAKVEVNFFFSTSELS